MRKFWFQAIALCLPVLTGCLSHTRKLPQPKLPNVVMSADTQYLVDRINEQCQAVKTMNATVEFRASVGGERKGQVTDYTSIRGYILLRKPEMLRILGLLPVVSTRAFDLASDGSTFKLLIPHNNEVITGANSISKPSKNTLENMRPYIFFDSLLIHCINPDDVLALTIDTTTVMDPKRKQLLIQPEYDLSIYRKGGSSNVLLATRIIHINRVNLLPSGVDIYDENGAIQTQAVYGPYQSFGDFRFPASITIKRPLEEYQIAITFKKLTVNQPLTDEQFELKIPEGTKIRAVQ